MNSMPLEKSKKWTQPIDMMKLKTLQANCMKSPYAIIGDLKKRMNFKTIVQLFDSQAMDRQEITGLKETIAI